MGPNYLHILLSLTLLAACAHRETGEDSLGPREDTGTEYLKMVQELAQLDKVETPPPSCLSKEQTRHVFHNKVIPPQSENAAQKVEYSQWHHTNWITCYTESGTASFVSWLVVAPSGSVTAVSHSKHGELPTESELTCLEEKLKSLRFPECSTASIIAAKPGVRKIAQNSGIFKALRGGK